MTKINFVTSFNEDILKNVGHHFLKSISEHWEPSLNLACYTHNCSLESYSLPKNKSISYKQLDDIEDYKTFKETNSIHDGTENGQVAYNWRLDVIRWAHKVYALTEYAFELAEKDKEAGWLIWIDADSFAKKRLVPDDILAMLPEACDVAYAGIRTTDDNVQYLDTSFMAFNLNKKPALDLLGDLRGAYNSGELISYREWHDAFITERLLNIYKAHGMKIISLNGISDYVMHFKGIQDITMLPVRDSSGRRLFNLSDDDTSPDIMPTRYKQILEIIEEYKPKSIIEVGTWNAGRAIEMALTSFKHHDEIVYKGFDLFEDATTETDIEEFNVKAHNTQSAVIKRLKEFRAKMMKDKKVFTFEIGKGNSRDMLKDRTDLNADFVLIGGGNSIKTVASDYKHLKHNPIVMIDHYFLEDKDGNQTSEEFQGTNKVLDQLKKEKNKSIRQWVLPSADKVRGGGHTHLAIILNDKKLSNIPKSLLNVPIVVNPRDCVSKEYIRNNIKENMTLIDEKKWLGKYLYHSGRAIIVSGGPYTNYDELKATIKKYDGEAKIVCVKHSYLNLLKQGIQPWACVVLDPRPITGTSTHGIVRKDLFKEVDSKTKFFVASMTDPSVTKYLKEKDANIWGWHAFTESLRDPEEQKKGIQNNAVKVNEELGIPLGATLITGGTCAAMRTIGIMHTMGFRAFDLFGFDCNMEEPTKEMKKETTGAEDEEPRPKYFQVGVKDKSYWTTGELLAMAQDCERTFADQKMEMDFTFHGENTLVSSLWEIAQENKQHKTFEEIFND